MPENVIGQDIIKMMDAGAMPSYTEVTPEEEPFEEEELPDGNENLDEGEAVAGTPTEETSADSSEEEPAAEPELSPREKALIERLEALEAKLTKEEEPKEEVKISLEPNKDGVYELFKPEEDIAGLTMTAEGMNVLSTRITNASVELAMRYVQPLITAEAARVFSVNQFHQEFYTANPDLRSEAATVSTVCQELITKDPNISAQDIFQKAASEARKRLGLPELKKRVSADPKAEKKPGFTGATGSVPGGQAGQKKATLADDLRQMRGALG